MGHRSFNYMFKNADSFEICNVIMICKAAEIIVQDGLPPSTSLCPSWIIKKTATKFFFFFFHQGRGFAKAVLGSN